MVGCSMSLFRCNEKNSEASLLGARIRFPTKVCGRKNRAKIFNFKISIKRGE